MVSIDIIGLFITICVISFRYPQYGLLAVGIHEFGRALMTVFLQGQIESIIAAGAFSTTVVSNSSMLINLLIAFGGPLANFIIGSTSGGVEFERTPHLINPNARLRNPVAVINLRLALISSIFNIFYLL